MSKIGFRIDDIGVQQSTPKIGSAKCQKLVRQKWTKINVKNCHNRMSKIGAIGCMPRINAFECQKLAMSKIDAIECQKSAKSE
jgi:hypothetical protein